MSFEQFNLDKSIVKALQKHNYKTPTPIQQSVIPLIQQGTDIMAQASTGTGKTAGFVLPILDFFANKVDNGKKKKIKALIITPTRELALQVAQTFEDMSMYMNTRPEIVTLIGGESIGDQLLGIQKGCDIVVATAGRLLDILNKQQIKLWALEYFVLDEADQMLGLGFEAELDAILKNLSYERQNLLFSATYPDSILPMISRITKTARDVSAKSVEPTKQVKSLITQKVIEVNKENKSALLRYLIKQHNYKRVLVFVSTKRASENLANKFCKYNFKAESFHGNLDQDERVGTIEDFKTSKIEILFATDIASRGLHIDDIDCVINYDLPRASASYIHRIGRTGRAGVYGTAISFVDLDSVEHFELIKKRCKLNIKYEQIKGFERVGTIKPKPKGKAPVKGKRKSKKDKIRERLARL